jgi:predicted alpha/beta superfamily hydrolase
MFFVALALVACGDPAGVPIDGALADAAIADPDASPEDGGGGRFDDVLELVRTGTEDEIDGLVHSLGWSDRWPLSDGERFLFVTRSASPPALVGDFNGWDTTRDRAIAAADGVHSYVVVTIAAPLGAKYKWFEDGEHRAPSEATAYTFDGFGEIGYVAPPTDRGYLERFPELATAEMPIGRTVRVFVPASFSATGARAILFHDGQNVFHPSAPFGGWRGEEALAGHPDALAIAIDNASDRVDAYTHVEDAIGGARDGGRADAYLDLIEARVLPFVRGRYGIEAGGDSLAIAGSSLGGLASIYAALSRPSLAGCAIAMSPTLGWGSFAPGPSPDALVHRFASHGETAIYLDSGGAVTGACADADADGVNDDADDSDNYCVTVQLRDRLEAIGYRFDVDLAHWHEPGAAHDEAAWAARLPRALAACASMGWRAP